MESIFFLLIICALAITVLPVITIVMVSKTNHRLDIFTRRSERLLDILFEKANDPDASKEDLGIFFNTGERQAKTSPAKNQGEQSEESPNRAHGKVDEAEWLEALKEIEEERKIRESTPSKVYEMAVSQTGEARGKVKAEEEKQQQGSFRKRGRKNWEKIIGENILNKIGIAILVLGIGYFVRHTFSNQNMQEIGNISIGFLAGIVLFIFGHRLRKTMRAFSSVLVGGAISVFYFTVSIAFRDYELINQNTAALAAVGITAVACFLATRYDRQELAIISLLGGLASPLMVSTGSGNHIVLFSYLVILNGGILFLANKKNWQALHPVSYFGTLIYFAYWIFSTTPSTPTIELLELLGFSVVFFGIFLAQNILAFKKDEESARPFQLALLASNSAALFTFGMFLLEPIAAGKWQGLFVTALAILHGILTLILFRKKHKNHHLKLLLTGFSLTFVSLIAPIQMSEHHITLFWAAEAAMLSWLGHRSGLKSISKSALLVTVIMLISLMMDWSEIYSANTLTPFFNNGILTTTVAALGIGASCFWQKQWIGILPRIELYQPRKVLKPLAITVAFIGVFIELNYQLNSIFEVSHLTNLVLSLYVYLFVFGWIWLKSNWSDGWNRSVLYACTIAGAVLFLCLVKPFATSFRDYALTANGFDIFMLFHYSFYILLLLAALKCRTLINRYRKLNQQQSLRLQTSVWIYLFIVITGEYNHIAIISSWYPEASIGYIKSLVRSPEHAILWSSMAFVAMYFGIKNKINSLRYFGLGLFALAMLRLFLFDLALISETGKTIAFVSLGVLLLLVSFMYQRIKTLLI